MNDQFLFHVVNLVAVVCHLNTLQMHLEQVILIVDANIRLIIMEHARHIHVKKVFANKMEGMNYLFRSRL